MCENAYIRLAPSEKSREQVAGASLRALNEETRDALGSVMKYLFSLALIFAGLVTRADAQEKRRVYVLHSGMHTLFSPADKNNSARTMKEQLAKRGILERDLVFLESPFPTATLDDAIPQDGLKIYLGSADPASKAAHDGYVVMHKALQAQGVGKCDELIWVGHSAGGQMGMTMA